MAGGVGDQGRNIILSSATAAINLRLVPNQDPERVRRLVLTSSHVEYAGGSSAFTMAGVYGSATASTNLDLPPNRAGYTRLLPDLAAELAEQLTARGYVTELGAALDDLGRQFGASRLAGVVLFSDFAHNGKGFDQEVIQRIARCQPARKAIGHGPQLGICPLLHLGLQLVYGINQGLEFPYFAIVAPANDSTT